MLQNSSTASQLLNMLLVVFITKQKALKDWKPLPRGWLVCRLNYCSQTLSHIAIPCSVFTHCNT